MSEIFKPENQIIAAPQHEDDLGLEKPKFVTPSDITREMARVSDDTSLLQIARTEEISRLIQDLKKAEAKWKRNQEWKTLSPVEQIEAAREIMTSREVMGPDEVEIAFGIKLSPEQIPQIPFSPEELERAKELGQFLVLRTDKAPDGKDLTMIKMGKMLEKPFADKGNGKVVYDDPGDLKASQEFFIKDEPEFGWALTSKELISNTSSKNYLEQTEEIAAYLEGEVFKDRAMLPEYNEAIEEFRGKKSQLQKLLSEENYSKYIQEVNKLKINRLIRQSPVETMYDILMYFQNNGERLLKDEHTWTYATDSDNFRVFLGFFDSVGLRVRETSDDDSHRGLGVMFSRKF